MLEINFINNLSLNIKSLKFRVHMCVIYKHSLDIIILIFYKLILMDGIHELAFNTPS
jgi:hypothetical protein